MAPKMTADSSKRDNTTPSCAVCNRRKVKCDRVYPCAPCRKTGLECSFPEPARKRARRKQPTPPVAETSESHVWRDSDARDSQGFGLGQNVADGSNITRGDFIGTMDESTSSITGPATHEQSDSANLRPRSAGEKGSLFIFGNASRVDHKPLPMSLAQEIAIGNAYRNYVDPVVKVFHCESAWTCIGHNESSRWNGELLDLTKTYDQCLFRAILFATAVATDGANLDGLLGDSGHSLIQRCRLDAETALHTVNFTKTQAFRVLQGLVLYLIALQSLGEDETVWTMLGMSIRIASGLGLPQDIGEDAPVGTTQSPYHLEMRRRLWWAIIALDARVTRILGRTGYLSHNFSKVPRPASIDDDSLSPLMSDIPFETTGLTDSVYVRYRATLSDVLPFIYTSGNEKDKCTGLMEMIDDAERRIEDEFIQHCDENIPIQLLTFIAGRGYIIRVKLAMYSIYPETGEPSAQTPYASEAFWLAKDSLQLFILLWTDPSLKPWQWHWKDFFGWHTLRILVQEISKRSTCSKVVEAWRLVKKATSLVVLVLKLGEEKARLVGDLRMLIEAGDIEPDAPPASYTYANRGAMVPSIRPGMGSNPHNALFPAMNSSFADEVDTVKDTGNNGNVLITKEFNLKKVNWTEMDRILLQLGTYTGG